VSALSLISYFIEDDIKAVAYATITVLESFGHMVGDPSMHQIYAASLQLPYFWHALPFFVAAVCIRVTTVLVAANLKQFLYFLAGVSAVFIKVQEDMNDSAGGTVVDSQESTIP
jgi:hypothetical protein